MNSKEAQEKELKKSKDEESITKMIKENLKKIISLSCCVLLMALSIVACTSDEDGMQIVLVNGNSGGHGPGGDLAMAVGRGRFIETSRSLPEEKARILDMVILEDGTIRIIDQLGVLHDSTDDGVTWSLSPTQIDLLGEGRGGTPMAAALSSSGSVFISLTSGNLYLDSSGQKFWVDIDLPVPEWMMDTGEGEDSSHVVIFGDEREYEQSTQMMWQIRFTSNHYILGVGVMPDVIYYINPRTGEILTTFGQEGGFLMYHDFMETKGQVFAFSTEGISTYDLESGRLLEVDGALREFFGEGGPPLIGIGTGFHQMRLIQGREPEVLNIVKRSGLYRYTLGGNQIEQVINGAINTMSNPAYGFGAVVEKENNSFLIVYIGVEDQLLMDYTFDPNAETVPSEEMVVFSMFDNGIIRQAISMFQSQNPHILVHHEIGITEGSAMTVSDVITALNTRMLAGSGPDILFFDDIPFKPYIKNGLLLELSELANGLMASGDFFENILISLREDGGIYVIPAGFTLLAKAGPSDLLGQNLELSQLANQIEDLRREDGNVDTIVGDLRPGMLLQSTLHYVYSRLLDPGGTVNESVLREFLGDVRRIYDANDFVCPWGDDVEMMVFGDITGRFSEPPLSFDFSGIMNNEQRMSIGAITNFFAFDMMHGTHGAVGWDYRVRSEFIPTNLMGINARSNRLEESKSLFEFMFSKEIQSSAHFPGLPVNVAGVEVRVAKAGVSSGSIGISLEDGGILSLDIYGSSVEQLSRLKSEIRQVSIPSAPNRFILEVILEEGVLYLEGNQSLEDAVEGILRRVNLFLAE